MRVYLPSTLPLLRGWLAAGEIPPGLAFAVTPALREWYAAGDIEELEYAALLEAARGSLRLLDSDPAAPRRRVVIAADVPAESVEMLSDHDRAAVRLTGTVRLAWLSAAHVDDVAAEAAVAAAATAVLAADLGSDEARFTVDEAEGHELLWFAAQELPALAAQS